jgi:hypothetical protein
LWHKPCEALIAGPAHSGNEIAFHAVPLVRRVRQSRISSAATAPAASPRWPLRGASSRVSSFAADRGPGVLK